GHIWGPNKERGIFLTADGGKTWKHTLYVDEHTGAVDLARDPAEPSSLYAIVSAGNSLGGANQSGQGSGVYRSDDAGNSWHLINGDPRLSGRGWYFGRIYADATNPDLVYIPNTSLYRSRDGGAHFDSIKGS